MFKLTKSRLRKVFLKSIDVPYYPPYDLSRKSDRDKFCYQLAGSFPISFQTEITPGKEGREEFKRFPANYIKHYNEIEERIINAVGTKDFNYKKQLEILAHGINIDSMSILLLGETGSGKSTLADIIHKTSKRETTGKFVEVNCSNLSGELLESALFGHEKGAFTGADKVKKGIVELADNGVLFLDEIDKADKKTRDALLKFLDTGFFNRVGGEKKIKSDVRIICGSNEDLTLMAENELFPKEFYYRIAGLVLTVPPLRKRKEDIEHLVKSGCQEISERESKSSTKEMNEEITIDFAIAPEALQIIKNYSWPGNIRQLLNFLNELYTECSKQNTMIATNSIVTKILPSDKLSINQKSLQNLETDLSDIFINWYGSVYSKPPTEINEDNSSSKKGDGFLQKIVSPILANIYENINPEEFNLNKTQKDKLARSIIGIGGYSSGTKKSTLKQYLEDYNNLIKQKI